MPLKGWLNKMDIRAGMQFTNAAKICIIRAKYS